MPDVQEARRERADLLQTEKPVFGLTFTHLSQLSELQDENARLKRMYADLALMHSGLKDVVGRKL